MDTRVQLAIPEVNSTAVGNIKLGKGKGALIANPNCSAIICLVAATPLHRRAKIASEGLKHRVFEISLADLQGNDEDRAFRKIRLKAEDVQGRNALTSFWGMDFTTGKLRSLVWK